VGSIDSSGFYTAPNAGIGNATIIATSGSVSGNATVSLIDDLSAIVPATQTTTPNQPLVFSAANEISITDGDAATQSVPLTLTLTVTGGTLSLSQLNGLTFSAGTGSNDSTVTFSGTVADIDSSLRGLKFTPSSGFGGTAILSVTIDEAGVSQNPPTKTVGIYVGDAASNSSPSTQAASTTQSPGSNGDNSVLTGILNQTPSSTTNWTSTPSQSSGGNSSSVFSQEPIVASETAVAGGEASAPAPAATAPNAPANPAPAAAVANAAPAAAAKTAGPAPAANHELPHATPIIPDKQVTTVPDQVFTFLAPKSEMLTNLDTMKTDMVSQKTFKVAAGSATVVSFSASAAYLVWMLRGGSLLSSLLSIFPAWKSIDPLPVLESFENSRKRRKGQADDESLESLVEKSNRNIDGDKTTKESTPETTGNEP
jgi:hypothetical protein